jgi:hypothetical protein
MCSLRKRLNVDSPTFTPSSIAGSGSSRSVTPKNSTISPKAANAAPFTPKGVATPPPQHHESDHTQWAVAAEAVEFVPHTYEPIPSVRPSQQGFELVYMCFLFSSLHGRMRGWWLVLDRRLACPKSLELRPSDEAVTVTADRFLVPRLPHLFHCPCVKRGSLHCRELHFMRSYRQRRCKTLRWASLPHFFGATLSKQYLLSSLPIHLPLECPLHLLD